MTGSGRAAEVSGHTVKCASDPDPTSNSATADSAGRNAGGASDIRILIGPDGTGRPRAGELQPYLPACSAA